MDEKIESLKKLLEDKELDKEVRCYLENQLESLERDKKISENYNKIIDDTELLINKLNIDNKLKFSNTLIQFIVFLKELHNIDGIQFLLDLQNLFVGVNDEDSKEIMAHVYTRILTENMKKRLN